MIKQDNLSISSNASLTDETKSKTSSFSSNNNLTTLTNNLIKSCCWLNDLLELHYFAYNSCNSLTIYSYRYWPSKKCLLISTKENNLKEIYFSMTFGDLDASNSDNLDGVLSARSSVSSENSNTNSKYLSTPNVNNNNNNNTTASTLTNNNEDYTLSNDNRKSSGITNSSLGAENKSNLSINDSDNYYLEPVNKIHKLSKIKSDALVSSIDVLDVNNFTVLSVTFALKRKPEQYYLHLYCDFETNEIDQLTDCEYEFELNAMPHRVTNIKHMKTTEQIELGKKRQIQTSNPFIFVNCSQKTNLYFSIDFVNRKFVQIKRIEEYFVELSREILCDNITSHDMLYLCSKAGLRKEPEQPTAIFDRRLSAFGSQNGWLGVFLVNSVKNEMLQFWEYENDSFITQLKLFSTKSVYDWSKVDLDRVSINLLALRSLEPTRIFNNVLYSEESFDNFQDLEISPGQDLVTSAVIYDATFSGYNSIVLGTFGKSVLFFCPTRTSFEEVVDKQTTLTNHNVDSSLSEEYKKSISLSTRCQFVYELKREITFKHSILGLQVGLISNNGALDLIILTLNGVSVWQYDPEKVIDLVNKLYDQHQILNLQQNQHKEPQSSSSNIELTTSF